MQKLAKEFKKWNFNFIQIERKGKYAIYEKFIIAPPHPAKGDEESPSIGFEVVVIQKQKEHERFGQTFPAKELYPSSEAWGTYGHTFLTLQGAYKKYKELTS